MMIIGLLVRQVVYPIVYTLIIAWVLGVRFKGIPESRTAGVMPVFFQRTHTN
jgi:hypothetical protein